VWQSRPAVAALPLPWMEFADLIQIIPTTILYNGRLEICQHEVWSENL
ncbi:hypothetical protein GLDPPO_GLDPPO_04660, partial [Dysosmobacter welbionis]